MAMRPSTIGPDDQTAASRRERMARVLQTSRFHCSRLVSSADFQRANADFGSKQLRLSKKKI